MTRSAVRSSVLLTMLALWAAPASSQGRSARPGAGYVARSLTGGIPVGAVRGRYAGTTEPVLFVVNNPTPDSTAISAFVGGHLVRRFSFLSEGLRFVGADIPAPGAGEPAPPRGVAVFEFDADDRTVSVLWNHDLDRWAGIVQRKADGARAQAGDTDWFGTDVLGAHYAPQGSPDGGLPARAWKQDRRQLSASGATVLHVARMAYREVPDVYVSLGVYNGEVGPVQTMDGITRTTPSSIDDDGAGACSGLPAVRDVDGDGHADFWLCDSESADGYQTGTYRLYDPEAGLFVKDLAFTFRGSHTFDAAARRVYEYRWSGAGAYQTQSEYDLASGVPVLVREQTRAPEDPDFACAPACRARFTTRTRTANGVWVTETRSGADDEYLPSKFGQHESRSN